ncbi:MAG: hypothetical protein JWP21_1962, partial [Tardiphaga sp.]|nr:hypothetical protein [Tardiphaga sp.]
MPTNECSGTDIERHGTNSRRCGFREHSRCVG